MQRRTHPATNEFAPILAAPHTEFEPIPDLEVDQTADFDGEATHDPLMHLAELGAAPISNLEFDQTLSW